MKILLLVFVSLSAVAQTPVKFRFPIADDDRQFMSKHRIYGVDHDHSDRGMNNICRNYNGRSFPNCYDQHRGTDFMLKGSFRRMDNGSAKVVAAASGIVTSVVDGNYDRCRLNIFKKDGVSCHGHPMRPNIVEIRHADGSRTRYLHLKKHSIVVRRGERVECGQTLALVGSSGWSTAPHLHFEVLNYSGRTLDPYSGPNSQPTSYWTLQFDRDNLPGSQCQ